MLEQQTPEYAILNDIAHAYSLLHYHTPVPEQRRQLHGRGFADTVAYDMTGAVVTDDTKYGTVHFLTRKPRPPGCCRTSIAT